MSSATGDPPNRTVVNFTLKIGERPVEMTARLPAGEARMVDLLPVLRKFNDALISVGAEDAKVEGRCVSCRTGCAACCRQVIPICEDEAIALLEWIDSVPENLRQTIHARFQAALNRLDEKGMLEATRNAIRNKDQAEAMKFGLDYLHAWVDCPFLINESCAIYPMRPMKCREYLVTSPPENCTEPTPDTVAMLKLPTHLSTVLFRFDAARRQGGSAWLPLVLLFEWAAEYRARPRRKADSLELFQEFLSGFADSVPASTEATEPIQSAEVGEG